MLTLDSCLLACLADQRCNVSVCDPGTALTETLPATDRGSSSSSLLFPSSSSAEAPAQSSPSAANPLKSGAGALDHHHNATEAKMPPSGELLP